MTVKMLLGDRNVETTYVHPPIPDRNMDWEAVFDDYEPGDLIGRGPTESDAIYNLVELFLDSIER